MDTNYLNPRGKRIIWLPGNERKTEVHSFMDPVGILLLAFFLIGGGLFAGYLYILEREDPREASRKSEDDMENRYSRGEDPPESPSDISSSRKQASGRHTGDESIYDQMKKRSTEFPEKPVPRNRLPETESTWARSSHTPGSIGPEKDQSRDSAPGADRERMHELFDQIRQGIVSDWKELERELQNMPPDMVFHLLREEQESIPDSRRVKHLFRETSLRSADCQVVRDALLPGWWNPDKEEKKDLFVLGQVPLLTEPVCYLLSAATSQPPPLEDLRNLLRICGEGGVEWVVDYMICIAEPDPDPEVQTDVLSGAMRRVERNRPRMAEHLQSFIRPGDVEQPIKESAETFEGYLHFVETLVQHTSQPHSFLQNEHRRELLRVLSEGSTSHSERLEGLWGMHVVLAFLERHQMEYQHESEGPNGLDAKRLRNQFMKRLQEGVKTGMLAHALRNSGDRQAWRALMLIKTYELTPDIDEIVAYFRESGDPLSLEVIGKVGEEEGISRFLGLFPEFLVDRETVESEMDLPSSISRKEVAARLIPYLWKLGEKGKTILEKAAFSNDPRIQRRALETLARHRDDLAGEYVDVPEKLPPDLPEEIQETLSAFRDGR